MTTKVVSFFSGKNRVTPLVAAQGDTNPSEATDLNSDVPLLLCLHVFIVFNCFCLTQNEPNPLVLVICAGKCIFHRLSVVPDVKKTVLPLIILCQ